MANTTNTIGKARSFTLVELMVVVSIISVVALVIYRTGRTSIDAVRRSSEELDVHLKARRVLIELEKDLRCTLARTPRGNLAFVGTRSEQGKPYSRLEFFTYTRWPGFGDEMILPQKVTYEVVLDNTSGDRSLVTKRENRIADLTVGEEAKEVLLRGLEEFDLSYLSGGREFKEWSGMKNLPESVAVRLALRTTRGGQILLTTATNLPTHTPASREEGEARP